MAEGAQLVFHQQLRGVSGQFLHIRGIVRQVFIIAHFHAVIRFAQVGILLHDGRQGGIISLGQGWLEMHIDRHGHSRLALRRKLIGHADSQGKIIVITK